MDNNDTVDIATMNVLITEKLFSASRIKQKIKKALDINLHVKIDSYC